MIRPVPKTVPGDPERVDGDGQSPLGREQGVHGASRRDAIRATTDGTAVHEPFRQPPDLRAGAGPSGTDLDAPSEPMDRWTVSAPRPDQLLVVVPPHPPVLNPAAAQALLALLIHLANVAEDRN